MVCIQQQTNGWIMGTSLFASFNPETGETEKAFLLPQKDPMFYDNYTYTYNRPELIKKPVTNGKEFEKIIPKAAILSTPKKNH